jgi:hypothetical protein
MQNDDEPAAEVNTIDGRGERLSQKKTMSNNMIKKFFQSRPSKSGETRTFNSDTLKLGEGTNKPSLFKPKSGENKLIECSPAYKEA